MKFFVLIFLSIFTIVFSKPLDPKRVLYAVDCGSTTITKSSLGFIYQKVILIYNIYLLIILG